MCHIDVALLGTGYWGMQMEMKIAPVPNEHYGYWVRLFRGFRGPHTCFYIGAHGLIKNDRQ